MTILPINSTSETTAPATLLSISTAMIPIISLAQLLNTIRRLRLLIWMSNDSSSPPTMSDRLRHQFTDPGLVVPMNW
jgi:hypothetical protein